MGFGRFTWSDGSYYEGNFEKDSIIEGIGIYHWNDGKYYKGEWKNNKMHGWGIFQWKDGKQYIGEYKFDKKEGYGRYVWNKERYFEGFWKDGKQHGNGITIEKDRIEGSHFRFGKKTNDLKSLELDQFKKNENITNDLIKKITTKFKSYEARPSKYIHISNNNDAAKNNSNNDNAFNTDDHEYSGLAPTGSAAKGLVSNIKIQYQSKNLKFGLGERPSPRFSEDGRNLLKNLSNEVI